MLTRLLVRIQSEIEGATAAEYAIMASLIAIVIIATVAAIGIATRGLFQSVPLDVLNG